MDPFKRFYTTAEDFRDPFSRDRDRVIHCSSFRRLEYKTQVFINHEGDYFRTRLTHSLEVAQIARTLARALGLNETLCEVIALSHDLGHTPFGHVGGDCLDSLLKENGHTNGFEHNFQSFRVLTKLEKRYKNFDGLNLTFATLEGVLKHSKPYHKSFFPQEIIENFALDYHPSLEAIIVDYADEIAYTSHDIDDGLKYKLISYEDIKNNPLIQKASQSVYDEGIKENEHLFRHRLVAALIKILVEDFIEYSKSFCATLEHSKPLSATIPSDQELAIALAPETKRALKELKKLLFTKLYWHEDIVKHMHAGQVCVKNLYQALMSEPKILPTMQKELLEHRAKHRVVADYIASMTDRYALKLYHQLYGIKL